MTQQQTWVAMGYIKGAFGVKGWVKIHASTEFIDGLLDYPQWRLTKDGQTLTFDIEASKIAGDELQVKFAQINDRDAAALLRGYTIEVPRQAFANTEKDEFYWVDLVGMEVINREHILLGKVSSLMQTGAHDVLIVRGEYGEKLIPFVSHYIDQVDQQKAQIQVDWGLDY